MDAKVSAPEVFKFGGEYGSLVGGNGVAAAGDKIATASIRESPTEDLTIRLPDMDKSGDISQQAFRRTDLESLHESAKRHKVLDEKTGTGEDIRKFKEENNTIRPEILPFATIAAWLMMEHKVEVIGRLLEVQSSIPKGSGCASSAACGAAVTGAFLKSYGTVQLDDNEAINVSRISERIIHGVQTAGGMDSSASYFGNCINFNNVERGKPTPVNIPDGVTIVFVNAGDKAGTGAFVPTIVALSRETSERGERVREILAKIAYAAKSITAELGTGDMVALGQDMFTTHALLKELGCIASLPIATEKLNRVVDIAHKAGALGAKLSGSGGGGWAVVLTREPETLAAALLDSGFKEDDSRTVKINPHGARHFYNNRAVSKSHSPG